VLPSLATRRIIKKVKKNIKDYFKTMKKIRLRDFNATHGNRVGSQLAGVSLPTFWRWVKDDLDMTFELEKGKPVAYTIRKEVRRED